MNLKTEAMSNTQASPEWVKPKSAYENGCRCNTCLEAEITRLKAEKDTLAKGFAEWVEEKDLLREGNPEWFCRFTTSDYDGKTTSELLDEYKKQMP